MTKSWKDELKNLVTEVAVLWDLLELPQEYLPQAQRAAALFPLRVTPTFLKRIKKGDIHDPLLKQCLPWHLENAEQPKDYQNDALEEQDAAKVPGLLHKYHGRVLLITTGICAINCRYCFRRHFPYAEHNPGFPGLEKMIAYIRNDRSIFEVILSGGDPLMMTDSALAKLLKALDAIPHVKTLRIHSRLPIVLPSRIAPEFLQTMRQSRLHKVMVIHANHAQELDGEVLAALTLLKNQGWHLLNQSVLLRGINDEAEILIDLQHKLFDFGVLPYYLHLLDRVNGAAHFEVALSEAQQLMWTLMQNLPGYLVPKLASEVPGLGCKQVYGINPNIQN
jgi:L-lysine 2,3-aminomutase